MALVLNYVLLTGLRGVRVLPYYIGSSKALRFWQKQVYSLSLTRSLSNLVTNFTLDIKAGAALFEAPAR